MSKKLIKTITLNAGKNTEVYNLYNDNSAELTCLSLNDKGTVKIKSEVDGYTVTTISAFSVVLPNAEELIVPETVSLINCPFLYCCKELESLEILNPCAELSFNQSPLASRTIAINCKLKL